jgi:ubiquinone/menaquinone biosynthesis C-methylase UbiE
MSLPKPASRPQPAAWAANPVPVSKPEGRVGSPVPAGASAPALDWGVGSYESLAAPLLPAARVVVESARLRPGERVLDLGCGTGNGALLAAEHSSEVTGVDPASRLLEIARSRAVREGKKVTFLRGEAASVPMDESAVDVILSVFALIFVPDPDAAAAEMARVLAPGGRIVLSAWLPVGAMFEMTSTASDAVRQALGAPPGPAPFEWEQRDALLNLLGPYGFSVEVTQHALAFTAPSAREFLDDQTQNHPMAVAGLSVLERLGQAEALRARLLRILETGNEDAGKFRVTSRYTVATIRQR